ncbi:MAG: hypothetical protein HZA54_00080 [Planctomycetes bacterium]|nr:hypothetical protein [Planctomycetota bacterium]
MLAWLEELTRPASWREGEEAVMEFYSGLLAGRIPDLPEGASPLLYRRLGYLLELAALRSEPPVADRLSAAAREARARVDARGAGAAPAPVALIGSPRRSAPAQSGDEVCRRWGLVTGLDLDRFAAYRRQSESRTRVPTARNRDPEPRVAPRGAGTAHLPPGPSEP